MQRLKRLVFVLSIFSVAIFGVGGVYRKVSSHSPVANSRRIRFDVAAFEEQAGQRNLISETSIEGPEGTDFTIKLKGRRFQMNAGFLTDLTSPDVLKVQANLDTRRFYGYSERDLPLYEEDKQKESLQLAFNEKIILLPFGRNDSSDQLKIEITPAISEETVYLDSGKKRPLEIKFPKKSATGEISVQASKVPHHYSVEGELFEDGKEVASGTSSFRLHDTGDLPLQPTPQAGPEITTNPLQVSLTIDEYILSKITDEVGLSFSVFRESNLAAGRGNVMIPNAAGVGALGTYMKYDLTSYYENSGGKTFELRLRVQLAPDEVAD